MNPSRTKPHAAPERLFPDVASVGLPTRRTTDGRPRREAPAPPHRVDLAQPLVDADVIAGLLCVKRKRIYELARRPDDPLPSVRIGRAVRFVRAQVEEWVAHQTLS